VLDLTNIVQTATGTSTSLTFSVTLPSATTAGNGVFLFVLRSNGMFSPVWPTGWLLFGANGGSGLLSYESRCWDTPGGETTWSITYSGTAAPLIWFAMEVNGAQSMLTRDDVNPGFSVCDDWHVDSNGVSGPVSTRDSAASPNAPTIWGDMMCLAFGAVNKASGAPPTVTGSVTDSSDVGVTWTALTTTTTTATGTNDIRLDVYYTFAAGAIHTYRAGFTWTASTTLALSAVVGFRGFFDPPQRVNPRASLNSTM